MVKASLASNKTIISLVRLLELLLDDGPHDDITQVVWWAGLPHGPHEHRGLKLQIDGSEMKPEALRHLMFGPAGWNNGTRNARKHAWTSLSRGWSSESQ